MHFPRFVRYLGYIAIITACSILLLCLSGCGTDSGVPPGFDSRCDTALGYAMNQLRETVQSIEDSSKYPVVTGDDGNWRLRNMNNWTSGYFPGLLWYAWQLTADPFYHDAAEKWTWNMEPVKNITRFHDTGIMMFASFWNAYNATGDESYVEPIVTTAKSLSTRFDPDVGLIQSWGPNEERDWLYPVIIDGMIVTEILYKAAAFTGNSEYADIATTHARTTARTHVRDDGSTYHVVDFDPETGEIRGKHTAQGYTAESCWSRGQAWGIYGFATTWRETGDPLFRDMAMKLADYFIENLPDDYIPYSDFNAPNIPTESRDTSAAALAASGMLELASLLEDTELQSRYRGAALNILHSLCSEPYLTKGYDSAGILRHATGKWRPEVIENVSLIFGDYYFVEALLRYRGVLDMPSEKG